VQNEVQDKPISRQ